MITISSSHFQKRKKEVEKKGYVHCSILCECVTMYIGNRDWPETKLLSLFETNYLPTSIYLVSGQMQIFSFLFKDCLLSGPILAKKFDWAILIHASFKIR